MGYGIEVHLPGSMCFLVTSRRALRAWASEKEVPNAPRSPWQDVFLQRLISGGRRDCLNHAVAFNELHLKRILIRYFEYHDRCRKHLSLGMDSPDSRSVQLPAYGIVIAFAEVSGSHHRYEQLAAVLSVR